MTNETQEEQTKVLSRRQWLIVLLILLVAICIRLSIIRSTYDYPGDGVNRSLQSYVWSLHPSLITSGYWVPGFTYLHGLALMAFPFPFYVPRIFNALLGSMAVLPMTLLTKRLFGWFNAVIAATALAFLPLHVGLSASGLTEAPFVTFVLLSFYLLTEAGRSHAERKSNHVWWLIGAAVSMIIATMIRCESWTYLPLWIGYYFFRTRSIKLTAGLVLALAVFPITWLVGCWADYHMPLVSFSTMLDPRNNPVSPPMALLAFVLILLEQLGPVMAFGTIWGFWLLARMALKDRSHQTFPERLFYLGWFAMISVMDVGLALAYGGNMQDRFALLLLVLSLPIAAESLAHIPYFARKLASGEFKKQVVATVIATLFATETILFTVYLIKPQLFITTFKPVELYELAQWLKGRPANERIVFTSMNYRAFFVPLLNPQLVGRNSIVMDFWTPLLDVRDELAQNPPTLLVTGKDDGADLDGLLHVVDFKIGKASLFDKDYIHVYEILPGSFKAKENPELPKCFWYPSIGFRTLNQPWKRKGHD